MAVVDVWVVVGIPVVGETESVAETEVVYMADRGKKEGRENHNMVVVVAEN